MIARYVPHKMIFVLSKIILISKSTLNQPLSSVLINSVGVRHSLTLLQIRFVIHICDFKVIIMASESLLWPHRCIFVAYKTSPFHRIDSIWSSKEGAQHILILASSSHLYSSERACLEIIPAPPQTSTAPLQPRFRYFPLTPVVRILRTTFVIMMTILIILTINYRSYSLFSYFSCLKKGLANHC